VRLFVYLLPIERSGNITKGGLGVDMVWKLEDGGDQRGGGGVIGE